MDCRSRRQGHPLLVSDASSRKCSQHLERISYKAYHSPTLLFHCWYCTHMVDFAGMRVTQQKKVVFDIGWDRIQIVAGHAKKHGTKKLPSVCTMSFVIWHSSCICGMRWFVVLALISFMVEIHFPEVSGAECLVIDQSMLVHACRAFRGISACKHVVHRSSAYRKKKSQQKLQQRCLICTVCPVPGSPTAVSTTPA